MTMLGPFSLRAENSCDGCLAFAPDSLSILGMQWKGKIERPNGCMHHDDLCQRQVPLARGRRHVTRDAVVKINRE